MPFLGYLSLPYIPNRKHKKKQGRPTPHAYLHRIAYTMQMRGDAEGVPTLLFYGASFGLVRDVCQHIHKIMDGNVRDLLISQEHSCRIRNGKCYWRQIVTIEGLNENVLSLQEFVKLIIARMLYICNCTVRYYKPDTFINL